MVRDGMKLLFTVPEPEYLDFSGDLDSMPYLTKRSGLQALDFRAAGTPIW